MFRYHQHVPGAYLPDGVRLVQLTTDPGEAARAPVGDAVVTVVGVALAQLADAVPPADREPLPPLPDFPAPRTGQGFVYPDEVCALLREHAPTDAIYVNESTSTGDSFWSQMDLREPGSYYFPASGGLGFGLPAAVGVQLACPDRRVVAVVGDGSANYGITALWTAAQLRVPVVFVILENGTYGALRLFAGVLGTGETPASTSPASTSSASPRATGWRPAPSLPPRSSRLRSRRQRGGPPAADRGDHRVMRKRVVVFGRVQGVFFRDGCRAAARRRGVAGWVTNRDDGTVEAVFEGDAAAVAEMVAWMRHGPPRAEVIGAEVVDERPEGLTGFAVR